MKAAKYFWDLNKSEWTETRRALQDPEHPRFAQRMVTLLSRCDQPKELFAVLPQQSFINAWPKIRSYWIRRERRSTHRDWWETLYEQMAKTAIPKTKGEPSMVFRKVGS